MTISSSISLTSPFAEFFGNNTLISNDVEGISADLAQAPTAPVLPVFAAVSENETMSLTSDMLVQANGTATNPVSDAADQAVLGQLARLDNNVTGTGITIGIMSDSFNVHGGYATDVADSALPADVEVLKEGPSTGNDEGRAMAELVHQIAPGANIIFYTAFDGEADFANGILALANAGANIIVDDVTYLDEPFFQDTGVVTKAVEQVVSQGVDYFTSASNEGSNFYENSFQGCSVTLPGVLGTYMPNNFGTHAAPNAYESLTIAKGATCSIDLQWDQPWGAAANSLGMVLYSGTGQVVAYALRNDVGGNPDQVLRFTNTSNSTSFKLAVVTDGGNTTPDLFKFIVYGQGTTINDPNAGIGSGTVIGHEMVATANTVGAVAATNTPAFGGSDTVESFSSVGSGTTLFAANGDRLATAISENKVNFLAPDGVATSVFNPFYGTSAAAPNAAGVAALMLQANPNATPAQISAMLAQSAVAATGPAGSVGAGLIQATTAVQLAAAQASTPHTASGLTAPLPMAASAHALAAVTSDFNTVLAHLGSDPSATSDFVATINPAAASLVAAGSAVGLGGSAQVLAMLNNGSQTISAILPNHNAGFFG